MAASVSRCFLAFGILATFPAIGGQALDGDIRLRGGGSHYGRVEVFHDGRWGTVCDDHWDLTDATVACLQLGFSTATAANRLAFYGKGAGTIWLDEVRCSGHESRLSDCPRAPWGEHNCDHDEDAGVECYDMSLPEQPPLEGSARLAGSSSHNKGRVEIFYRDQWGTVCDDMFERTDAEVICRQLSYSGVESVYSEAYYSPGTGPIMYQLGCTGFERTWAECSWLGWDSPQCSHSDDASVICISSDDDPYAEGDVRLIGDTGTSGPDKSDYRGTVEVYYNKEWGTICDDQWSLADAKVVCRQLGYPGAAWALDGAYYGQGSGPILLDEVNCKGGEHKIVQCDHDDVDDCDHSEDAGVICELPTAMYYPRLVDGDEWYEGRVEVWDGNRWERVCDTKFLEAESNAACQQLGFAGYRSIYHDGRFGEGDSPPSDVGFHCAAHEDQLSSCDTSPVYVYQNCSSVGIRCKNHNHGVALSLGAIIGIVVTGLCCIICLGVVLFELRQSRKKRHQRTRSVAAISGSNNITESFSYQPYFSHMNDSAPPSYEATVGLDNPVYYPPRSSNS